MRRAEKLAFALLIVCAVSVFMLHVCTCDNDCDICAVLRSIRWIAPALLSGVVLRVMCGETGVRSCARTACGCQTPVTQKVKLTD